MLAEGFVLQLECDPQDVIVVRIDPANLHCGEG